MSTIDLAAIGFIVIAALVGAYGYGFRWLKRLAGFAVGALVGGLLLGTVGLVCLVWLAPESPVNVAFRDSPVLRLATSETTSIGRRLGIDMESFHVDSDQGGEP